MIKARINPLYILLFFVTVFIISLFKVNDIKNEFDKESSFFKEFEYSSKIFASLKKKKTTIQSVERITRSFKKENLSKKVTKKMITLTFQNNNIRTLNRFVNSILKGGFELRNLKVTKNKIEVEILR